MNKFCKKKYQQIFLCFSLSLFAFSALLAKVPPTGTDDSVSFSNNYEVSRQKVMIQKMNREQLSSFVDNLFQLDTIPHTMLNDIDNAIAKLDKVENKIPVKENNESSFSYPSSEYYDSWDTKEITPDKDFIKSNSGAEIILHLTCKEHNNYLPPAAGGVSSDFGWRDSIEHKGIDIQLRKGDKVTAAMDGMVRVARNYGGFGNVVIIRHYNGLETVYAHLSKIKVKTGQVITAGQLLGLGGSTGRATGAHLHFEVRFKGIAINPKFLISFTENKLLCDDLVIKPTKWGLAAYPKNEKTYIIEKGDTIFEIAKHFATTSKSIKEINGFTNGRIRLKPGQQIQVLQ